MNGVQQQKKQLEEMLRNLKASRAHADQLCVRGRRVKDCQAVSTTRLAECQQRCERPSDARMFGSESHTIYIYIYMYIYIYIYIGLYVRAPSTQAFSRSWPPEWSALAVLMTV